MRWWAFWRRVQYATGFFLILGSIGIAVYYTKFYVGPTCFDEAQNAEERGIDCGGACTRICAFEVTPPEVLWAESFKIIDGQYNAVAYIENRNAVAGIPEIEYTFALYDDAGLITEKRGTTVLPPDSVYPIFEGRIITGDRIPTKTFLTLGENPIWLPSKSGREQFTLEKRELVNVDSKPRLIAQVQNLSLDEAREVEVVATIFDSKHNPLTAASTFVDIFPGRSTEEVIFTWPYPIAKTLRSCETPTDVMLAIDLSGSMNNDGGTPPQPITTVLASAQSFVSKLKQRDLVGLVTYATNASLVEKLTNTRDAVGARIKTLTIDPKEETGSTNIGAAMKSMHEELTSARHSSEARKVAILLTDGLATAPNPDPDTFARSEALALKGSDTQLFTIGLGAEVNEALLRELASSPKHYYKAPTIKELEGIYTAITKDICEDGPAVIEVIPKTKTTFEELR